MADDDLPSIIPLHELNLPDPLPHNATLNQSKQADVEHCNQMLKLCYLTLGQAKSVSAILKTIDTATRQVVERRKLLCLQYGDSDKSGSNAYTPIDD